MKNETIFSGRRAAPWLLAALLILRFPVLMLGSMAPDGGTAPLAAYLVGTQLCTALLFWLLRDRLDRCFVTLPALILFLLSPLFAWQGGMEDPTVWLRALVCAALAWGLWRRRAQVRLVPVRGLAKNLLLTAALVAAGAVLFAWVRGFKGGGEAPTVDSFWRGFCYQMAFAAVLEEPLFRAFLPALLESRGLRPAGAVLVTAGLFWLGHLYYMGTGANFWVVIPLASLLLGFAARRTGSVGWSMGAHALLNTLGDIFQHALRLF